MQQDIYFSRRPSLDAITGVYDISSLFLLIGVLVFSLIIIVSIVSLIKITHHIRQAQRQQAALYAEMVDVYKKQLKLLHGKHFLHSLHQYIKLLVQLGQGKDAYSVRSTLGYDDEMIQYIEKTLTEGNELDYEQEKHMKDILHQHIEA